MFSCFIFLGRAWSHSRSQKGNVWASAGEKMATLLIQKEGKLVKVQENKQGIESFSSETCWFDVVPALHSTRPCLLSINSTLVKN